MIDTVPVDTTLFTSKQNELVHLDPRVKLVQVLVTGAFAFSIGGRETGIALFSVSLLFTILGGQLKTALTGGLAYGGLFALAQVVPPGFGNMIEVFWLRIFSLVLALIAFYSTTDVSELISALRNMKMPQTLVVMVAVILRFFPSIMQDIVYIRQGMKTRGVSLSIIRPLQLYEGFLVPLLMRVLTTGNDLAASAETRGISCPCAKSSFLKVKMRPLDYGIITAVAVFYILLPVLF